MRTNPSEKQVIEYLISEGCEVVSSGWPDLLVKNRQGHVFALELKAENDKLSKVQLEMHHALHTWTFISPITRRYSDVADLPDSEEVGMKTLKDAHEQVYDEGYREGYAQATTDMIDKLFQKGGRKLMCHSCAIATLSPAEDDQENAA